MKVTVRKKNPAQPVEIYSDFIKLQDALKFASLVATGGEAKQLILDEMVAVNGEICTMRGKKLYPGDRFSFDGTEYLISIHESL